ncbi:fumarylacetoacetate hydrolase protein [Rutstroemia sp. NJR-2017a WRK4]|nr:fumarylacetoacetate hydrolase protein [Rutstroemia sp. NJR-2017a WRK4]
MSPSFSRLIRFLTPSGSTHYGDAILPSGETDISKATHAHVITGDIFGSHTVTDQVREIRLLLAPLAIEDVKSVRCLGLNYEQHAKEVGGCFVFGDGESGREGDGWLGLVDKMLID